MVTNTKLGRQGLEVTALGLGCMGMSSSTGSPTTRVDRHDPPRDRPRAFTFLDTADIYGPVQE